MLRIILFAFLGLFILTGTNFEKNLMAEQHFFEEGKYLTEKWLDNETKEGISLDQLETYDTYHVKTEEDQQLAATDKPLSKDEAITKVMEEFSMTELLSIAEKVGSGLSGEEIEELKATIKERFSPEDIDALKELGKNKINQFLNPTEE
ncbi:hypothetical protein [Alkalihalobacterium chitinilyticum]|uniref:Uncharacterized protein n=1 Tax=Alkalihalobacterium chitinilyticum TaxID=2980103 RepID=A0ABT5VHS4_9BACI|nr:hypothetical protein [Alkalihalobacterium chitinilyticum]MDE5414013.1 hypothetical protein [Alkalihalobacterium chitinilyticum]